LYYEPTGKRNDNNLQDAGGYSKALLGMLENPYWTAKGQAIFQRFLAEIISATGGAAKENPERTSRTTNLASPRYP
jgi:hypothetical protein